MRNDTLRNRVRQVRTERGLTQSELAERVGVSRQALSAIEAGRQVPSTLLALHLASELGRTVESLFTAADESLVARGHAMVAAGDRVALGRVNGRLVALPCADPSAASDGVIERVGDRGHSVELLVEKDDVDRNLLVAGCAPILGALAERVGRTFRDARATWMPTNSTASLQMVADGLVHLGGVHFAEASEGGVHERLVRQALQGRGGVLVTVARWRQGLVVAAGNPLGITGLEDLGRSDLRVAHREEGAAAQALLSRALEEAGRGFDPGLDIVAESHVEVAMAVRWGVADVGVTIESAALERGLDFLPLREERFDLVVTDEVAEFGPCRRLVELLDSRSFRRDAARIAGYDVTEAGHSFSVPGA